MQILVDICGYVKEQGVCLPDGTGAWYVDYRMNWGWNGTYNGWYTGDDFSPGPYNFTNSLKMIYNIKP